MDIEKLDKKINAFLDNNKEPIISVTFDHYVKMKKRRIKFCGVFSVWNKQEGLLWLKSKSKGSRDKKNSVRMPTQIEADNIISIKAMRIQDLIDNTNLLYLFTEEIKEKTVKIN